MKSHIGENAGCLLVGDYLDEAEFPEGIVSIGQPERPLLVVTYLDLWSTDDTGKEAESVPDILA